MSIRLRLTLWLTALLAVVLTGLAVLVYVVVADQMENRLDATLRERTADIHSDSNRSRGRDDRGECKPGGTNVAGLDTFSDMLYAELYDQCGNLAARSSNLSAALPIPPKYVQKVLSGRAKIFSATLSDGTDVRILGTTTGGDPRDQSALFAAMPLASLESDLFRLKVLLVSV